MTPQAILESATADGLSIGLSAAAEIQVKGPKASLARWAPLIREHKAALLQLLAAKEPTAAQTAELRRLVRSCGIGHGFSEQEHHEALQIALADPENALTCFRAMAAKLGVL